MGKGCQCWKMIPNLLTVSRIIVAFTFPAILMFHSPYNLYFGFGILVYIILTDFFDGFLARKYDLGTKIGQFLDPVADKITTVCVCITAPALVSGPYQIPIIIGAILITARELMVSSLRQWMAECQVATKVKVNFLGKLKTCCQGLNAAMLPIIANYPEYIVPFVALTYATVLVTCYSGMIYLKQAWPHLKSSD
jgi:CDP-diacylglycerol--glycerol-3-phosphate 3-phosphatidyltransferase